MKEKNTGGTNMKTEMVAIREVTKEEFFDLAQNGARELFELAHYKIFDAVKGEEQNHFVYEMKTHRCALISKDTCYELVTAFYCGGDKDAVLENLNTIASSIQQA